MPLDALQREVQRFYERIAKVEAITAARGERLSRIETEQEAFKQALADIRGELRELRHDWQEGRDEDARRREVEREREEEREEREDAARVSFRKWMVSTVIGSSVVVITAIGILQQAGGG